MPLLKKKENIILHFSISEIKENYIERFIVCRTPIDPHQTLHSIFNFFQFQMFILPPIIRHTRHSFKIRGTKAQLSIIKQEFCQGIINSIEN